MNTLQNNDIPVALVTGAATRIGATIVRLLHREGYRILLHYRHSHDAALKLAMELNTERVNSVHCVQADLLAMNQLQELADTAINTWQRLDVLINNASSFYPTALDSVTESQWDELFGSNAKAPLFLAQHLHTELKKNHGCIVNIADVHGKKGMAGFSPYTMAKAALINMTKSLAREFAPDIRVNAIAPGAILWPEHDKELNEAEKAKVLEKICLGRLGKPEDIAQAVLFLVTKGSYITGQTIAVDGGRSLNL